MNLPLALVARLVPGALIATMALLFDGFAAQLKKPPAS
jgi:hypothetical protein